MKKSRFQLTTDARAYYSNLKWLQHICQSKLFEELVKMIVLFLKRPFLTLMTLIHINIKCLQLITELFTVETKVKNGDEAAGVIFSTVDHRARKNPLGKMLALHRPID